MEIEDVKQYESEYDLRFDAKMVDRRPKTNVIVDLGYENELDEK